MKKIQLKETIIFFTFCLIFVVSSVLFCACETDPYETDPYDDGYMKKKGTEQVINDSNE